MISLSKAERSAKQKAYAELFTSLLEKYGVKSQSQLDADQKSKFFSEVKSAWKKQKTSVSESSTKRIPSDLKARIEKIAQFARKGGQYVEIDTKIDDTVFVYRGEHDEYSFRHDEARDLLDNVPSNIAAEDYILWQAQSW